MQRKLEAKNVIQISGVVASVILYILIFIFGPDFIVPMQTNDAATVSDMALNLPDMSDGAGGGYYYTALALSYLPEGWRGSVVACIALIFIGEFYRKLRGVSAVSLAFFLCVSPIILFLFAFVKDTFTPILCLSCLFGLSRNISTAFKLVIVVSIYLIYGLFFRQYYLLIAGIFLYILLLVNASVYTRFVILSLSLAALLVLPDHYFYELGGARDFVNRGRMWENFAGSRTAFNNFLPSTDLISFTINYFYAVFRLNLSFIFAFTPREIFLSLNLLIYGYLSVIGLRSRDPKVRLPALLFVAHILVLQIFEPDLGSYLRHSSSAVLYLVPALALWDGRRNRARLAASSLPGDRGASASLRGARPIGAPRGRGA